MLAIPSLRSNVSVVSDLCICSTTYPVDPNVIDSEYRHQRKCTDMNSDKHNLSKVVVRLVLLPQCVRPDYTAKRYTGAQQRGGNGSFGMPSTVRR